VETIKRGFTERGVRAGSAGQKMTGTTRLELATSAVTVHNLRMHLNAAESTELQRRIGVRSEWLPSFLHYPALKIIALHGVEKQGYDKVRHREQRTVLVSGYSKKSGPTPGSQAAFEIVSEVNADIQINDPRVAAD